MHLFLILNSGSSMVWAYSGNANDDATTGDSENCHAVCGVSQRKALEPSESGREQPSTGLLLGSAGAPAADTPVLRPLNQGTLKTFWFKNKQTRQMNIQTKTPTAAIRGQQFPKPRDKNGNSQAGMCFGCSQTRLSSVVRIRHDSSFSSTSLNPTFCQFLL